MTKKMQIGRVLRSALLGSTVLAVMPSAVGCLDRPVAPATPQTSNTLTDQVRVSAVDKIDLLFMIDNSASMADKQQVLVKAVPDLVDRLINPVCVKPLEGGAVEILPKAQQPAGPNDACPPGTLREFNAIKDIHIGVVTSSLGGHGSDYCKDVAPDAPSQAANGSNFTQNDRGRLIQRGPRPEGSTTVNFGANIKTYGDAGFFAWDPDQKQDPVGEKDANTLKSNFSQVVLATDQIGCGYEASLESWYRFLVDPTPPNSIPQVIPGANGSFGTPAPEGIDEVLLAQRAAFLRPDSLVAIINLSDENDCSIIDGALPADVCDDPDLDESGNPVGCKSNRVGWPAGYAEGNFDSWANNSGRISGSPFPVNQFASQQNANGVPFRLNSGTPECTDDPYSPNCRQCYTGAQGCQPLGDNDSPNLRCWNQKQRFGVDMLYPLKRYVDGLTQTKVYDRSGFLVTNPLFDDLPYKQAKAKGTPLKRSKAEPRNSLLVFYAGIVGVPWQDIANDPKDLTKGYKSAVATKEGEVGIDWDIILGDPFNTDKALRKGPSDPLMVENKDKRSGTHPITNEPVGGATWNTINGREWDTGGNDLQYACVFDLEVPKDCSGASTSCDCTDTDLAKNNPLCETTPGSGQYSTSQIRAKAFPGTRFLQVAKDFGQNAIVASICTPNLKNADGADFGYRPAVAAIIDRLKTQLSGRCLPRQLAANPDGSTPCLIIDARFKKDPENPNDPNEVSSCKACNGTARKKIDPSVEPLLTGGVLDYECLCEVTQLEGNDLSECQSQKELPLLSSGGENGGWCYVDPGAVPADKKDAATAIVEKCPANEKRTIRFVNAQTENTTLFITCLGAASGNDTVSTGQ